MPLFICAKCECVENTALGHWWTKHHQKLYKWDELSREYAGRGLCSACAPIEFSDGTPTGKGDWHGKFDKEHWTDVTYQDELLNIQEFR